MDGESPIAFTGRPTGGPGPMCGLDGGLYSSLRTGRFTEASGLVLGGGGYRYEGPVSNCLLLPYTTHESRPEPTKASR